MIAVASSFTANIVASPAIPESVRSQAQVELAGGVPFVSDADLEEALEEADVDAATSEAALDALPGRAHRRARGRARDPGRARRGCALLRTAHPDDPAHNGPIREFPRVRRELLAAVDDSLFPCIEGTTDSETMFDVGADLRARAPPRRGIERMVGCDSRSLYFSTRMDTLKALDPELVELAALSDETRVVVSEPLGDLPGAWNEVPECHFGVVQPGADEPRAFTPAVP